MTSVPDQVRTGQVTTAAKRLREADPGTTVLADGFSCRTQIHDLDSGGHEGSTPSSCSITC
jgi:hypothetical protein